MRARKSAIVFACVLLAAGSSLAALAGAGQARPDKKGKAPAPPADPEAGRALFAKVVAGLGGAEKIAAVRDVRLLATAFVQTAQGELNVGITQTTVYPDRLCQVIQAPIGTMTTVITPQAAFVATPQGVQDLPDSLRSQLKQEFVRSSLFLAQHASDPKLSLSAAGKEKIGEVEAAILDVRYDGAQARWFVDPSAGRVLRIRTTADTGSGPAERVTDYSDFRQVQGLFFAFHQETRVNGEKEQAIEVNEIRINTSPDPKIFERPATRELPK